MPVWIVHGEEDRVNPRESNLDLFTAAVPHARVFDWPGVGHLPDIEVPERVNALLPDLARSCT